jgi:peptidoglycan/LPS O-acetylase OafA/YrhL
MRYLVGDSLGSGGGVGIVAEVDRRPAIAAPDDGRRSPTPSVVRTRAASGRHVPALDGVRGIAVLLVLAFHAWPHRAWTAFGWTGVDLFFVLSGFLITGVLVDGRNTPDRARTFYVRRALRIMPLYYGALLLLLVVLPLVHPPQDAVYAEIAGAQAWLWTYTSNWFIGLHHPPFFNYVNHFWSLAVEEQFYLLWPFVVWHATRETAMKVAAAALGVALVCRTALVLSGHDWLAPYFLTPCRLDALAVGALIALALRAPGDRAQVAQRVSRLMAYAGMAGVAVLAVVVIRSGWQFAAPSRRVDTLGITAVGLTFGWLVTVAAIRQPRLLEWGALRAAGRYSYGLYVVHPFVIAYADTRWPIATGSIVGGTLTAAASLLLACASYHGYEKHFLSLKSRLAPT